MLARDEKTTSIQMSPNAAFADRKRNLVKALCAQLAGMLKQSPEMTEPVALLRSARRKLRETRDAGPGDAMQLKTAADMLELNLRLWEFAFAAETVSQEGLAEHLKRIRNDYLKSGLRDTLNRFVPQPVGPRTADIRVPEPLAMHEFLQTNEDALELIRSRMQAALDTINAGRSSKGRLKIYPNPFHG